LKVQNICLPDRVRRDGVEGLRIEREAIAMENSVGSSSNSGNPLEELRQLVERLERQEAIRKAKERQRQLAALGRYALDTRSIGGIES
jgi:hypothetical protein